MFKGDFALLYSPRRYENRFPLVLEKIKNSIPTIAYEFNGEYIYNTHTKSFKKHSYKGKNIIITFGLIKKLFELSPQIVITEGFLGWTPFVLLYCCLFRKKLVIHYERTLHTERHTSWFVTLQRKLFNLFVDAYLVNGTETRKYLNSIGVHDNKINLAGMSADTQIKELVSKLSPGKIHKIKKKYNKNTNGILYLYIGRISYAKGADRLIEAWGKHIKKHPNDTLIMAGDGELLNKYQNHGLSNLHLLGRVEYDNIYKLYAIADVFVIATMQDNWSLVVPEAMSCGIPVATSIYNGCHTDLIKEGITGFTFNPINIEEIISVLDKFHISDLKKMGRHAIEFEKMYSIDKTAQRIYDSLSQI